MTKELLKPRANHRKQDHFVYNAKMKKRMITFTLGALLLGTSGCAIKAEDNKITYSMTEGTCSTGEHSFSSTDEMCNGLKDNALNNGCAYTSRRQRFESDCAGKSWN
jgi:hypothetical protein